MISIDLGNIWDMLSAVGTIGAVFLSLYLSIRQTKPKLYLHSVYEKKIDVEKGDYVLEISNIGEVPTIIIGEGITPFRNKILSEWFESTVYSSGKNSYFSDYSTSIRPQESITLEIDEEEMYVTINKVRNKIKKKKYYWFVIDGKGRYHYASVMLGEADYSKLL